MKPLVFTCGLLLCSLSAQTEEGFHKFQTKGSYKTPMIPGTEFRVHQIDRPQPPRVVPGKLDGALGKSAPSDAVVLFDGGSLEQFRDSKWTVRDGYVVAGEGGLVTKESFGDCQLHIEWRSPNPPSGSEMSMGNSGIFLMGKYELQVFDSYSCRIYADGSAAAIYGQTPPLANACRPPGEWQSYDVIFTAPVFDGEKVVELGWITVLHNGVLVQNHTKILGPTRHQKALPYEAHAARMPMFLQGHGSPVEYRNIWIRDLAKE